MRTDASPDDAAAMMEDPEQPPSTGSTPAGCASAAGVEDRPSARVEVGVADRVRAPAAGDRAALARFAQAALGALDHPAAELSVLLCGDRFMRGLNRRFRGVDAPTDVLSFEQDGPASGLPNAGYSNSGPATLGDVVISLDTARRQARRRQVPESAELRELLLHGILHLLGRDHGDGGVTEEPMLQEQQRLLERLAPPEGAA